MPLFQVIKQIRDIVASFKKKIYTVIFFDTFFEEKLIYRNILDWNIEFSIILYVDYTFLFWLEKKRTV